jgi:hypothetical protein
MGEKRKRKKKRALCVETSTVQARELSQYNSVSQVSVLLVRERVHVLVHASAHSSEIELSLCRMCEQEINALQNKLSTHAIIAIEGPPMTHTIHRKRVARHVVLDRVWVLDREEVRPTRHEPLAVLGKVAPTVAH